MKSPHPMTGPDHYREAERLAQLTWLVRCGMTTTTRPPAATQRQPRTVTCPSCGGSGEQLVDPWTPDPQGADTRPCIACDGYGVVADPNPSTIPGTPEAVHPGEITAERFIEDDSHTVVLDLTGQAGGLDGILADLARAIADAGLMDEFRTLAVNRANPVRCLDALDALTAQRRVLDVLRRTITPEAAEQLCGDLDEAAMEPDPCRYPLCGNWAVADEWCMSHVEAGDR